MLNATASAHFKEVKMKDLMKKSFLLGIGITALTKDKIKKELEQYMKNKNINKVEAKKFTEKVLKDIEANKKKYAAEMKKQLAGFEKQLSNKAKQGEIKVRKVVKKETPKVKKAVKKVKKKVLNQPVVKKVVKTLTGSTVKKTSVRSPKKSRKK